MVRAMEGDRGIGAGDSDEGDQFVFYLTEEGDSEEGDQFSV
jgi:hypothetical protein